MLCRAFLFAVVSCVAVFGAPGFYVEQLIQVPLQSAQSINSLTMVSSPDWSDVLWVDVPR
jgi:hypothetical protein